MCSWCWGFSPVMESVKARYGDRLPVRLILGGLSVDTTRALDTRSKQTIRAHWQHVAELAGQPFDYSFFERESFVYNTEPACRAVVAARRLSADSAMGFLDHLHRAFYAENQDITDRATLLTAAQAFGIDHDRFEAEFDAEETREETLADFQITRNTGIDGYPALLAGSRERDYSFITLGYQPWHRIEGTIEAWLESQAQRATS